MRALVTGATGFVGSHLTQALIRRGDSVRILARTPERARALQAAGAEVRLGDLGETGSLQGIAEGIDVDGRLLVRPAECTASRSRSRTAG